MQVRRGGVRGSKNCGVAFLGLGIMGEPMAGNLLRAGYALRVWNRTASRADALVREGAIRAATPGEAVRDSEFALVMVADPQALEAVTAGPEGILAALSEGSVLVNMGTQAVSQVESMAAEAARRGGEFLDAPVTGSRIGAVEGTLTVLAGGEPSTLEKVRPVLSHLGKTILHVGRAGNGTRAKLVLNLIQAGMLTVWAEGLALGKRMNLPPGRILQILEHSAGNAGLFRYKGPSLLERDFSTNFSLKLMSKDIQLALAEAGRAGASLPASRTVGDLFSKAMAEGLGEEDFLAIARIAEQLAGTTIED